MFNGRIVKKIFWLIKKERIYIFNADIRIEFRLYSVYKTLFQKWSKRVVWVMFPDDGFVSWTKLLSAFTTIYVIYTVSSRWRLFQKNKELASQILLEQKILSLFVYFSYNIVDLHRHIVTSSVLLCCHSYKSFSFEDIFHCVPYNKKYYLNYC